MTQYTFSPKDFKAFEVEGLDQEWKHLMTMSDLNFIN